MIRTSNQLLLFFVLAAFLLPGSAFAQNNPLATASWISAPFADTTGGPCPVFQKLFSTQKAIRKATLYITAHGLYEAAINGKRVGKAYFTPGFTPYDKELFYQQYDVTALLNKRGAKTLAVTIGNGWYRGVFGPHGGSPGRPNIYGRDASLLARLVPMEIIFSMPANRARSTTAGRSAS